MDLSPEDSLRLNVLLSQGLQAVRIDESRMVVHALTTRGEAKIPLNPKGRSTQYVRDVKALFSSHSLGSPGGYPVYLKRWTRMGQAKDDSLEQLLMLGEEEAVVAVVHAAGLTNELARRAWWCMPTADNARRMLEKDDVVKGDMGPVLAEFLVENLPFEEEPLAMIDSVRAALQPGLISDDMKRGLWSKAKMKSAYYVGFLQAIPDELPVEVDAHPAYDRLQQQLAELTAQNNRAARQFLRVMSQAGQNYLHTIDAALKRPSNQDMVVALFMTIEKYFRDICPGFRSKRDIEQILAEAGQHCEQCLEHNVELRALLETVPEFQAHIQAMLTVSGYCEELLFPVFGQTDAVGSVMRKKIKHLTDPLLNQLSILRN
ncbi:MAG: hypothetical protein EP315_08975 [Gammaproteobacteria bacterium]|nr:MAG: hypothetical protein EP315_08975 [Gammaproteobacteria bacterium]